MLIDVGNGRLKQFRQLDLSQPDRLVLEPALDAGPTVFRLVQNHFGLGCFVVHGLVLHLTRRSFRKESSSNSCGSSASPAEFFRTGRIHHRDHRHHRHQHRHHGRIPNRRLISRKHFRSTSPRRDSTPNQTRSKPEIQTISGKLRRIQKWAQCSHGFSSGIVRRKRFIHVLHGGSPPHDH